ncbi:hypothetical protein BDK51DRAFT_12173, partial [Blyttiomyces helicus]
SWQRFSRPDPPERGAFPLDLGGVCTEVVKDYMECMRAAGGDNSKCRDMAKAYLRCRMDKGLMEKDSFDNLGFRAP